MTDKDALAAELKKMINKSKRALKTAKENFLGGDYESASSRAYYSVFHIMQAALLTKNLSYAKHSGVISGFSQHFIKTGIFPADFSKKIIRLIHNREIGDYSYSLSISKEQANEDLETAGGIIKQVISYLGKI